MPSNRLLDSTFLKILDKKAKQKEEFIKRLESMKFEYRKYPKQEIRELQQASDLLDQAFERKKIEFKKLDEYCKNNQITDPTIIKNARRIIEEKIIDYLQSVFDKMDVWKYKYSTSPGGTPENMAPSDIDSIYYMSESGANMRFKTKNKPKGNHKYASKESS